MNNRRRIVLFTAGLLLGATVVLLSGCNTFTGAATGFARDVESAGRGIADALTSEPPRSY